MLHDPVLLEILIEHFERPARIDHEILRNNFEPVHDRLLRENMLIMRHTEADSDAIGRLTVKLVCRHEWWTVDECLCGPDRNTRRSPRGEEQRVSPSFRLCPQGCSYG